MKKNSFVAVVIGLLIASGVMASEFSIRPYIQNPTADSIVVMWSSADEAGWGVKCYPSRFKTKVTVGKISSRKMELSGGKSEYLFEAKLTGLNPKQEYKYEVKSGATSATGLFRLRPKNPLSFRFAAYGDTRTDNKQHRKVALELKEAKPEFIIHSGDMVGRGKYKEYHQQYFDQMYDVADHIPVWIAPGNHEGDQKAFKALFNYPNNERWYSFDYGPVHFVALDSNSNGHDREVMREWLVKDLSASKAQWKIVFYHHPPYDIGRHRTKWGRDQFLPVFRKYGVDMVINGHTHTYQRFFPMYTPGENDKHPITYVVCAGGAAGLSSLIEQNMELVVGEKKYNYMIVDVTKNKLHATVFVPESDEKIDEFTISKDSSGRLSSKYLATAMPETEFDIIRDQTSDTIGEISVMKGLPKKGESFDLTLNLGTKSFDCDYTIELMRKSAKQYKFEPIKVSVKKGEVIPVKCHVTCTTRHEVGVKRNQVFYPYLQFKISYDAEGRTGYMYSDRRKSDTPYVK